MQNERDYILVQGPNCHVTRRKEILEKYPQVRELYGNYPLSALYIMMIVSGQLLIAYYINDQSWWAIFLVAYLVGAFANHSLYVMIHDCCHNTVFRKPFWNKVMGIICDIPLVSPSAMGFRKYHMIHHKHLGEYSYDPDITSYTESKLVGRSALGKAMWLFFFSISQMMRPMKVRHYKLMNGWIFTNIVVIVAINIAIYVYMGPASLIYLALSTLFALGLHPLGGRWIQEHYITKEGQETYSYYGPLNKLTFNMGYHNEHHDFMNIPWVRLPQLKKMAPEYYDTLKSYNSWTKVLVNFIFNPEMDQFSRIIHPDRHPKGAKEKASDDSDAFHMDLEKYI
jgi:sphingolipid delta-4 desaturase